MSDLGLHSMADHRMSLLLLKSSNNRMSHELETAEKECDEIRASMAEAGELVSKLEKMDRLKMELDGLRKRNAKMNVVVASLSMKTRELQEDLFDLQKDAERVQKHHSEVQKEKNELINLRSKLMPEPELLRYKNVLAKESAALKETLEETGSLKNDLPMLIEARDGLKEELEKTIERIPVAQERITSTKDKIERLAPKVVSEEEVQKLADEVRPLRPKKAALAEESKNLSPRVASIAKEEEKMTSILEAYRMKNEKDKARLSDLKNELKGLDIDKDAVDKLQEKVSSVEGEYELKKAELEKLKESHSEVLNANQKYKAIIEEVEKGTESLKELMKK